VDFDSLSQGAAKKEVTAEMDNLRREFNLEGKHVGVGGTG